MIRRFMVFCGKDDRPSGGWYDFVESFDTHEQAREFLEILQHHEWWQIVDLKTGETQIGRFNQ